MKDVSEIIAQRLQKLEGGFSLEWLSDFGALVQFFKSNLKNSHIVKSIQEGKKQDHLSLISSLERLLEDGRQCLRRILKETTNLAIKQQIEDLCREKLDLGKLSDPFFELESFYSEYYRKWVKIVREIIASVKPYDFLAKYALLSSIKIQDTVHLQVDLSFSKHLRICETEAGNLAGKRSTAIWGKWDLILRWEVWTKNGIAPGNEDYRRNLGHLFNGLKMGGAVHSVGLYFIEKLISEQIIAIASPSIHALELFLDAQDRYWILTHSHEKGRDTTPFFIKKLQNNSNPHRLLKLLLETEPGSSVEFEGMSHALGELEIKNGLEKAFFPFGRFMGCYVGHKDFEPRIDLETVLKRLESIQSDKRKIPAFDNSYYFRSKTL